MNNVLSFALPGIVILLFAGQCNKEDVAVSGTPDCVQAKIEEIAAGEVWNPPAKVYSFVYNGKKVYYITSRCCDIPSQLFDDDCNLICRPDGGYTGKGDNACPDFFETRTSEKLIWEDERKNQ